MKKFNEWKKTKQSSSEKQKDVDYKSDKESGVRQMDSDLSKDYKKYAKKLGTVDPFKLVKKEEKLGAEPKIIPIESPLIKAYESYISSISNDGIKRADDKIGDLTKNIQCRILKRDNDEDIGFVSLPPEKYEALTRQAAKMSGLSLSSLKSWGVCHLTKFSLKATTQVYLTPTNR